MTDHPRSSRHEQGMRVRREVLGDAHVDRAVAATTPFTEPFQDFLTRYAWGEVWARPGLNRRTRSAITLAVLTTLHARDELAMHVRAALRNGLTAEEISEVLLHTALYAGLPAANEAYAIARDVLGEGANRVQEGAGAEGTKSKPEPPGGGQAPENVCPQCAGTGQQAEGTCPACGGDGLVVELVGDA